MLIPNSPGPFRMSDAEPNPSHDSIASPTGTLEIAAQAAQRGAADAREAAARTWTATGRFVNRFVYTTCYTLSYGVVFPSVLLARSIPVDNAAVRGLIEGAQAARQRAEELCAPALESSSGSSTPALAAG